MLGQRWGRETRDLGVGVILSVEPGSEQFFGRLAVIYLRLHSWPTVRLVSSKACQSFFLEWRIVRTQPRDGVHVLNDRCNNCGGMTRNPGRQSACHLCHDTFCQLCVRTTQAFSLGDDVIRNQLCDGCNDPQQLPHTRRWLQTCLTSTWAAYDFHTRCGLYIARHGNTERDLKNWIFQLWRKRREVTRNQFPELESPMFHYLHSTDWTPAADYSQIELGVQGTHAGYGQEVLAPFTNNL
jgi:hypothetical protein